MIGRVADPETTPPTLPYATHLVETSRTIMALMMTSRTCHARGGHCLPSRWNQHYPGHANLYVQPTSTIPGSVHPASFAAPSISQEDIRGRFLPRSDHVLRESFLAESLRDLPFFQRRQCTPCAAHLRNIHPKKDPEGDTNLTHESQSSSTPPSSNSNSSSQSKTICSTG